jgi:hypothetical protein
MVAVVDVDVPCSLVDGIILDDRVAVAAGEHVVVLLRLDKKEILLLMLFLMDLERINDAGWNAVVVPPPPNARTTTRRNFRMR